LLLGNNNEKWTGSDIEHKNRCGRSANYRCFARCIYLLFTYGLL